MRLQGRSLLRRIGYGSMNQLKLMEKILTNRESCKKIVDMSVEDFKAALMQRGIDTENAEDLLRKLKETISGGELNDSDLEIVSGGVLACYLEDKDC